ncbi:uncharacterized protein [Cicer arietinum]|uniref:Uncharacterized protein LOC101491346 n=1 Tax=Cicer arietinum TaxID=3827 RepID=A0A3Q7YC28_CICAR|nr:uncharacterized protein LOC101491346 [Cicer arietinum]
MNGGGFSSNLPIMDGKNWERWYASMRSLLGAQEVFEIVQDGYEQLDECRSKKVQRVGGEAQLAQADSSDSDEVLLMASTSMEDDCPGLWYLDTWCSNHMTRHKEWFVSINDKVKREIRFADNSYVTAEGIGEVLIQRRDGKQSFICDVLYVPNMKNNLLSLGQLLEKGYSMKMEQGEMRLFDDSRRLILKAPLSKNRTSRLISRSMRANV